MIPPAGIACEGASAPARQERACPRRDQPRVRAEDDQLTLELRLRHLLAYFGVDTRLSRITTGAVEAYKAARLAEPLCHTVTTAAGTTRIPTEMRTAAATVNREITVLARMGTLARHQYGLVVPFVVEKLKERNAREGFFDGGGVRCRLPAAPP